jgi:hypothetical protein
MSTNTIFPYKLKRTIAFIDRNVDDLGILLAGISPHIEPILLSDDELAPQQDSAAVRGRAKLDAIQVILDLWIEERPRVVSLAREWPSFKIGLRDLISEAELSEMRMHGPKIGEPRLSPMSESKFARNLAGSSYFGRTVLEPSRGLGNIHCMPLQPISKVICTGRTVAVK